MVQFFGPPCISTFGRVVDWYLALYHQMTFWATCKFAFSSPALRKPRETLLRWRYCIVPQINVTVSGAHVVCTEHWLCNRQARLLREFSGCSSWRQDGYVWRVSRRADIFIRSTFGAGASRVGQPHVHVRSVWVGSEASSTCCNVGLWDGAVDRGRWTVWPLHATTAWTAWTPDTRKTLNASSLVDVFKYVTKCSSNAQLSTNIHYPYLTNRPKHTRIFCQLEYFVTNTVLW